MKYIGQSDDIDSDQVFGPVEANNLTEARALIAREIESHGFGFDYDGSEVDIYVFDSSTKLSFGSPTLEPKE